MKVLDFIEAYYKNEPGAKKITKKNLTKAVREQFIPSSIKISDDDFKILGEFGLMTFVSATNPDDYLYSTRQVKKVRKSLEQDLSAGLTGANVEKLSSKIAAFKISLEQEKIKRVDNNSNYIIRAIFNRGLINLNLPENIRDKNGVLQGEFIKTAGRISKSYFDSKKLVVEKDEIKFKQGDSYVKLRTERGEVTRAVITSLMLDIGQKLDEKYPQLGESEKASAILLATFITLRGTAVAGEEEATQKIIEELTPYMLVAMENVELETKQLRKIALDVANEQLQEFGVAESGEKLFQALAIESQLKFSPADAKDVPSSFVREGGMFPYNYITIEGKPNYIPLQYFTPDSNEVHDVNIPTTQDEALKQIANAEIAQEALGGFYFFDKRVVEDFDKKPTFKTICELNLTNLLILANVDIDPQVSETMQQMFVLPLIQSFDKLSTSEKNEVITNAMKNLRKTGILPREAFAQIELLDEGRKAVKNAGKYGNFQRFELDVNEPLVALSKQVAQRLSGILKLKKYDDNPNKGKERTVLSKASLLLGNAQFYFAAADGQCYGQDFQVWLDWCKKKYPEIVDSAELETLLRVVYEPLEKGRARFEYAKSKTKFTTSAVAKLIKRVFEKKPKDVANEAVEEAFKKPAKNNPTITI